MGLSWRIDMTKKFNFWNSEKKIIKLKDDLYFKSGWEKDQANA